MSTSVVACVDFGSTFTKAALVGLPDGVLLATAQHPTTLDGDLLDGWVACRARLAEVDPRAADAEVLACSSAGGGLRIAVVGNEELVTAEAGRRVALSSGGHVVHVGSGGLDPAALDALEDSRPDVVLLVGGTNGGNAEVLEDNAEVLARRRWAGPVVVAGNVDSQPMVASGFAGSGTPYVLADNVVPRIGVLTPASAREAIREMFVRHVIGGKHLSAHADFTAMVRGATPDVVLTAVELLAHGLDAEHPGVGDVVVVDVGGATTDVHSVVDVEGDDGELSREVVASVPLSRTVEGDLGMRWSAVSTVEAGTALGLVADPAALRTAAGVRRDAPAFLPDDAGSAHDDERLASLAVAVGVRRHAGRRRVAYGADGRVLESTGKDLREVDVLVGSGGLLRSVAQATAAKVLAAGCGGEADGWQLPHRPRVVVDRNYVLAPAGLLAHRHPAAAHALLGRLRHDPGWVGAPAPSLDP